MKEELKNSTNDSQEEIKKFYIQSVNFETFMRIVAEVNMADSIYLYNMPNHIKTYAKDVNETTKAIFNIFENHTPLALLLIPCQYAANWQKGQGVSPKRAFNALFFTKLKNLSGGPQCSRNSLSPLSAPQSS